MLSQKKYFEDIISILNLKDEFLNGYYESSTKKISFQQLRLIFIKAVQFSAKKDAFASKNLIVDI